MPLRSRAGSSPLRSTDFLRGPSLLVTSPSRPPDSSRLRRGSLGTVEAIKERARRDTATSSDLSSENELNPSVFRRKTIRSHAAVKASHMLSQRIQEDDNERKSGVQSGDDSESAGSSLSSGFSGSADSNSLLGETAGALTSLPGAEVEPVPAAFTPNNESPKRSRQAPALLQALPPPRPISVVQPVSALSLAIKARNQGPRSPFERYASLSGKGDPNPLYIKLYAPFTKNPAAPIQLLLRRSSSEGDGVTVADAIGFSLWRYLEEGLEPPISSEQSSVNHWTLRMVEDGEVDYDFPALGRTRPIVDFTSNNNRGVRGRSRDKPWDEFALVEATREQVQENDRLTPALALDNRFEREHEGSEKKPIVIPHAQHGSSVSGLSAALQHNPITGHNFMSSPFRKDSANLLDAPAAPVSHATPRKGAPKTLSIRFTDNDFSVQKFNINVPSDTYIAEVFDQACKKLNVDKGLFILKVAGTSTVAPLDRTVEALGDHFALDLVRRRFVGDGTFGLSGSPGSSSPNAPLLIPTGSTPRKGKKGAPLHPLNQKQDYPTLISAMSAANYKRYAVTRKQPMSFNSSSSRILALDEEYMHIMPGENAGGTKALFDSTPKTVTAHFSSVVGSKVSRRHPRHFRVMVYRERETKRYDFEAANESDAHEIVKEIKKGMERFQDGAI